MLIVNPPGMHAASGFFIATFENGNIKLASGPFEPKPSNDKGQFAIFYIEKGKPFGTVTDPGPIDIDKGKIVPFKPR